MLTLLLLTATRASDPKYCRHFAGECPPEKKLIEANRCVGRGCSPTEQDCCRPSCEKSDKDWGSICPTIGNGKMMFVENTCMESDTCTLSEDDCCREHCTDFPEQECRDNFMNRDTSLTCEGACDWEQCCRPDSCRLPNPDDALEEGFVYNEHAKLLYDLAIKVFSFRVSGMREYMDIIKYDALDGTPTPYLTLIPEKEADITCDTTYVFMPEGFKPVDGRCEKYGEHKNQLRINWRDISTGTTIEVKSDVTGCAPMTNIRTGKNRCKFPDLSLDEYRYYDFQTLKGKTYKKGDWVPRCLFNPLDDEDFMPCQIRGKVKCTIEDPKGNLDFELMPTATCGGDGHTIILSGCPETACKLPESETKFQYGKSVEAFDRLVYFYKDGERVPHTHPGIIDLFCAPNYRDVMDKKPTFKTVNPGDCPECTCDNDGDEITSNYLDGCNNVYVSQMQCELPNIHTNHDYYDRYDWVSVDRTGQQQRCSKLDNLNKECDIAEIIKCSHGTNMPYGTCQEPGAKIVLSGCPKVACTLPLPYEALQKGYVYGPYAKASAIAGSNIGYHANFDENGEFMSLTSAFDIECSKTLSKESMGITIRPGACKTQAGTLLADDIVGCTMHTHLEPQQPEMVIFPNELREGEFKCTLPWLTEYGPLSAYKYSEELEANAMDFTVECFAQHGSRCSLDDFVMCAPGHKGTPRGFCSAPLDATDGVVTLAGCIPHCSSYKSANGYGKCDQILGSTGLDIKEFWNIDSRLYDDADTLDCYGETCDFNQCCVKTCGRDSFLNHLANPKLGNGLPMRASSFSQIIECTSLGLEGPRSANTECEDCGMEDCCIYKTCESYTVGEERDCNQQPTWEWILNSEGGMELEITNRIDVNSTLVDRAKDVKCDQAGCNAGLCCTRTCGQQGFDSNNKCPQNSELRGVHYSGIVMPTETECDDCKAEQCCYRTKCDYTTNECTSQTRDPQAGEGYVKAKPLNSDCIPDITNDYGLPQCSARSCCIIKRCDKWNTEEPQGQCEMDGKTLVPNAIRVSCHPVNGCSHDLCCQKTCGTNWFDASSQNVCSGTQLTVNWINTDGMMMIDSPGDGYVADGTPELDRRRGGTTICGKRDPITWEQLGCDAETCCKRHNCQEWMDKNNPKDVNKCDSEFLVPYAAQELCPPEGCGRKSCCTSDRKLIAEQHRAKEMRSKAVVTLSLEREKGHKGKGGQLRENLKVFYMAQDAFWDTRDDNFVPITQKRNTLDGQVVTFTRLKHALKDARTALRSSPTNLEKLDAMNNARIALAHQKIKVEEARKELTLAKEQYKGRVEDDLYELRKKRNNTKRANDQYSKAMHIIEDRASSSLWLAQQDLYTRVKDLERANKKHRAHYITSMMAGTEPMDPTNSPSEAPEAAAAGRQREL